MKNQVKPEDCQFFRATENTMASLKTAPLVDKDSFKIPMYHLVLILNKTSDFHFCFLEHL